ncbi:sulfite exporter TauE/SafE family protein [Flavobacterium psychroterrae]|uniref:Probable membrane transporter protein n=1 Tax=Flavobacterium psychroterrae TaxID=2133767 RepID=A0ABS5PE92_9FLAO|nr:sulfite exporter TauE/SafE family protein [Flavobacterium psychroterrae]MBS7232616.1 sulfite exporter TauE/SafE family protein [Flavobacterium psychroterrae]
MEQYATEILLFLAAIAGSVLNAVAGGGGFIAFPSLVFAGAAPVNANAISTVALWPGNMASAKAFEKDIKASRRSLVYLLSISGLGGFLGAMLLIVASSKTFEFLVPYFLLFSWLLFSFSTKILEYFKSKTQAENSFIYDHKKFTALLALSIYGGYFGAGMGMMVLTVFTFYGMKNLNEMNGLKVLMVAVNNGIAAFTLLFSGFIDWYFTIVMIAGALIGGYYGAAVTRKVNQDVLKKIIIIIGGVITLYFFIAK